MTPLESLDRYLNLFVKPLMILTVSIIAGFLTAASFVLHFKLPPSLAKFRSLWFNRLWSLLGPISAKGDAPYVRPLIKQAHGVVVELGYDIHLIFVDPARLTVRRNTAQEPA